MIRKIGVGITPLERRPNVFVDVAMRAEELGYDFVSVPEGWGHDPAVLLSELARRTNRIELATGVVSIWGRSAASLAMLAASVQELSGGRFGLGMGTGTAALAEGFHDLPFRAPAARLEDYVVKLRALLDGEPLPDPAVDGARPLRLAAPPSPTPIHLAAMSPRTMAVAGAHADGWLPFFLTPTSLAEAVTTVVSHRPADLEPLDVRPAVFAAIGASTEQARDVLARVLVLYLTVMGDIYPRLAHEQGYSEHLRLIREANSSPTDGVVPEGATDLLADLWMFGTADDAPGLLEPWFDAGATSLAVTVPPNAPWDIIDATLEAFAPTA